MLEAMPAALFVEWRAYVEGLGETDDQYAAATISASLANELRMLAANVQAMLGGKPSPPPVAKESDYRRRWRLDGMKRAKRQSPAELLGALTRHRVAR